MRSPCLILCFALVLFQALSFAAVADEGGDHRLALEFLDKTKHLNGQVSQQFRVHLPQKDNGRLRIFYQDANAAEIYTLHPENHLFSIVVDTPTRIHLVVVWQGEQQTHGDCHGPGPVRQIPGGAPANFGRPRGIGTFTNPAPDPA